jgi:hypothetical protein
MRALYLQEARLGVEIGPYLLGFSQWAGDGQNRRQASNAPTRHVKKAPFPGTYGANRDRTGDLLFCKNTNLDAREARKDACLLGIWANPAPTQSTRIRADWGRLSAFQALIAMGA